MELRPSTTKLKLLLKNAITFRSLRYNSVKVNIKNDIMTTKSEQKLPEEKEKSSKKTEETIDLYQAKGSISNQPNHWKFIAFHKKWQRDVMVKGSHTNTHSTLFFFVFWSFKQTKTKMEFFLLFFFYFFDSCKFTS